MSPDSTSAVALQGVAKTFGSVTAVDGVNLEVADGEFFSMLGPSGSGKTTVLRMVAGFETPTRGSILLDGRDVTRTPPYARDVNTVFQDYALFPHLDVMGNVEYSLRVKKVPRRERRERAEQALRTVRLDEHGDRRPSQLSGGQRQRVALARALVNEPRVLLLDEPLGALDLKLRREMQVELTRIQREVGITFLFVTHDQEEALTLSDRIAVFDGGRIQQVATPSELYEHPATAFVAGFVGITNVLAGAEGAALTGVETSTSLRPEKLRLVDPEDPTARATGHVAEVVYLGSSSNVAVETSAGPRLTVLQPHAAGAEGDRPPVRRGDPVGVTWSPDHVVHLRTDPQPAADSSARPLTQETS